MTEGKTRIIAGFAGAVADAFTLFERFEGKLKEHNWQLQRAAVELAKDWRTDKMLRQLEAMMIVADKDSAYVVSGNGEVIEPEDGVIAIGSGGPYAQSAARALLPPAVLKLVHEQSPRLAGAFVVLRPGAVRISPNPTRGRGQRPILIQ